MDKQVPVTPIDCIITLLVIYACTNYSNALTRRRGSSEEDPTGPNFRAVPRLPACYV